MKPAFQVRGLDDLRRDLRRLGDKGLTDALKRANKTLADAVIRLALPKVPTRSGRLKQSVRGLGNQTGAVGKAGGAAVPYAAAIHWGRKQGGFIKATPFLHDAASVLESEAPDIYAKEIEKELDAVRHR